jgi:hypothetical protein
LTPREQIIDAAKVHVATVRKSAADQIATAEEIEALVTNGLTERIAGFVLMANDGNASKAFFDLVLADGKVSGAVLAAVAGLMANATSKTETDAITEEIVRGLYGNKPAAKTSRVEAHLKPNALVFPVRQLKGLNEFSGEK